MYLDEKGKRLIEVEHKGLMRFADQIRYALSEAELKQFVEILQKIAQSAAA